MAVALGRLTGMGQDDLDTLFVAGMLHDIGKLGIPLALLEKPGQLTDEEFPKVKRHADLSRLWLDAVPGFERVSVWGGGHHERLDGKGYPLGLKGEEIPLPSRIMAIADVFTALTEDRPYRKGMTPPEALRIVKGMVKQGHLDGDLHAGERCHACRAQRHFGFAKADIATDQTIHRRTLAEVLQHIANGVQLVVGFLIGEAGAELVEQTRRRSDRIADLERTFGRQSDKPLGHFTQTLFRLGLTGLPSSTAQTVQLHALGIRAVSR